MHQRLIHVSEEPGIKLFEPRDGHAFPGLGPLVFAVDEMHLPNYLLPRDCPRVTFRTNADTEASDIERFLDGDKRKVVVAVEDRWFSKIEKTTLNLYEFSSKGFSCIDEGAGYYAISIPVKPKSIQKIENLNALLLEHGVDFQKMESLWPHHDAVAASSLQFSMIRMRNAQPRH